jgi:hypothetical protein
VPLTAKYFGAIGITAFTLTHVHHDVLLTLGPPVVIGGYFAYKWYHRRQIAIETGKVLHHDLDTIRVARYDESDISNVMKGLENQFDHFKANVVDVLEQKIADYVVEQKSNDTPSKIVPYFTDGDQITINMRPNELETFIMTKLPPQDSTTDDAPIYSGDMIDFIKLSLPFYSSKDKAIRKRLGVIQVYLLESPQESEKYIEYKICIEVVPYSGGFAAPLRVARSQSIVESSFLQDKSKTTK